MGKKKEKKGHKKEKKAGKAAKRGTLGQDLRHAAEPVLRLAQSPLVNEVVAGALVAGLEAFASSGKARKAAKGAGAGAGTAAEKGANRLGDALSAAAEEVANRFIAAYQAGAGKRRS